MNKNIFHETSTMADMIVEHGLQETARRLGKSPEWIQARLVILNLIEPFKVALIFDRITISQAYRIGMRNEQTQIDVYDCMFGKEEIRGFGARESTSEGGT